MYLSLSAISVSDKHAAWCANCVHSSTRRSVGAVCCLIYSLFTTHIYLISEKSLSKKLMEAQSKFANVDSMCQVFIPCAKC